jgi:two-component system sensor histidine kinase CpxA
MGLKTRFDKLSLFWKLYIIIVALLVVVVGLAELVLENLAKMILSAMYGEFLVWHEVIMWIISVLVPSLACGYILSRHLSRKLEDMVTISEALARGNIGMRLPVIGNDNDAFDKLARSFNNMVDTIDRQLQNERRLLVDISHELRSPLTRMTIAVELLQSEENAPKDIRTLLRLEKEILRMNELVELLLSQSPGHVGKDIPTEEVDLRRMLIELTQDFLFQERASGKIVICRIPDELKMTGNELLLRRMVGNIIANALFHSRNGSEVFLTAAEHENRIEIVIRDFGPGVPEENLKDIFRAFYRVDSSRARKDGGTGLGLALAREASLSHSGDIVARNVHPGLEVTVTLPFHKHPCKKG